MSLKKSDSGIDIHEMSSSAAAAGGEGGGGCYIPPVSLWKLIEHQVSPHERDEIKNILGEGLVEQSLELHSEVETLLEIWRDFRDEMQRDFASQRLPEPPVIRERLCQEIKFFIENIREKASNDRNLGILLSQNKPDVIDYCMTPRSNDSGFSRPSTGRSLTCFPDGRDTPLTPSTDRSSKRVSGLSDEVEAMTDQLNVLKIQHVTKHLREYLEEEVEQLLKDIEFLQKCLDEESNYDTTTPREPSLPELREERSKLEKQMLELKPAPQQRQIDDIFMNKSSNINCKPQSVRKLPINSTTKPNTRSGRTTAQQQQQLSPVKANHNIRVQVIDLPAVSNPRPVINPNPAPTTHHAPTPPPLLPPSGNKLRPTSADRFRRMVLQHRD
ncbi:coiled-coil domain-containing protein 24-like [Tubulanus polymorphus]|uniref:coiled-coil domain-containing protein 24-like n=1 Tax=Tubulanus polymorphus TaxID=672921 RepID=UPI003DA3E2BB